MISVENSETKDPPSTNDQVLPQSVETDYADKFISDFNSFEDFFEALTKIDNKESTPKQETKGHILERFCEDLFLQSLPIAFELEDSGIAGKFQRILSKK